MSDQSQGEGWWLASDGKWYPPADAPGPGWWKASDGNWYPPADAPGAASPTEAAAPTVAGSTSPAPTPVPAPTPTAPADPAEGGPTGGSPTGGKQGKPVSAGLLLGAVGGVAVLVLLITAVVFVRNRGSAISENGIPVGVDEPPASSLTLADDAVVVRSGNGGAVKEISGDGKRIVLDEGADGAGNLEPGKAMILTGVTAVKVKSVERTGGQVVVQAEPAALTDLIKDGTLSWKPTNADLGKASLRLFEPSPELVQQEEAAGPGGDRVVVDAREVGLAPPDGGESAAAYVDIPLAQAGGQPVSRSGTLGDYRYELDATIASDSVRFNLRLTTDKNGFAIIIDVNAEVQGVGFSGNLEISAATVRSFRLDTPNLAGRATITARAAAGPQASRIPVNVLRLPMSVQIPFPIYGIPFTVGIDASARVEVQFTSRDASIEGSFTARFGGSGGFSVTDGTLNTTGAFNPDFDDPIGSIQGAAIAPAAIIITIQYPKVSLGVGMSLARASAYIAANYSFSPLISGVTNITPCRAAPVVMKIKAGYSASFLGQDVAAGDKVISERSATPIDPPIKACEF